MPSALKRRKADSRPDHKAFREQAGSSDIIFRFCARYDRLISKKKAKMIRKIIDSKALDVDTKNRKVKVAISRMDTEDRDEEIIAKGAYNQTIKAKGPQGSQEIWHLTDHGWRIADSALSKYEELSVQGDHLVGVAGYRDTFLWREVAWPLYEAGDITQHSVGFLVRSDEKNASGKRVIKEIELFEGSAVLWGSHPDTPTMEVVKSHLQNRQESFEDRITWICKALKAGKYAEDESLLVLELRQLEDIYTRAIRKGTPPPETDTEAQKLMLGMARILQKY